MPPENVVGDRLDKLSPGQQVHLSPPVLDEDTPDEGWRTVTSVASDGGMVTVVFDDDTTATGRVDQLVRIGW